MKPVVPSEPLRCAWAGSDPLYRAYHDTEWGVPSFDERHLFEMLNLGHHRFEDVTSLPALLAAVQTTEPAPVTRMFRGDAGVAPEYGHFLRRGLALDPASRWSSASEMIEELHAILDGRCRVQCMATFSKRMSREAGRAVDHSPVATGRRQ